ncbi:MAG TPA: DUF2934 domain-containing protein [Nitrospira sp.]|nr:DUF2934 domain-containing protein [Nitrospira sp.]
MKKKTAPQKAATRAPKQAAKPSVREKRVPEKRPGPVQDIQVRIAARAHELYEQRGCLDGYHMRDWLEAEREILGHPVEMDKSSERI